MPTPFEVRYEPWETKNPLLARTLYERRQKKEQTEFELPPTWRDVEQYLHRSDRTKLIPGREPAVSSLEHEQALHTDLELARLHEDTDEAKKLRELIWASSARVNKQPHSQQKIDQLTDTFIQYTESTNAGLERVDAGDAEALQERIDQIREAVRALELKNIQGDDLEDAARVIEHEYNLLLRETLRTPHRQTRKKLQQELSGLRIIRDALYKRLLFPYMQ